MKIIFFPKGVDIIQNKEIVYEKIYSDFLIRLCEGEFPLGSHMPSLPELCTQYDVGKNTIIKVVQKLKNNGFIETSSGKVGQVLFDCNNLEQYVKELPGFVCDKDILLDYYYAMEILFPALYAYAPSAYSEEDLLKIKDLVEEFINCELDGKTYINLSIKLSEAITSAIENQLIKKIVEITMQKTMLPAMLLVGHNTVFTKLLFKVRDKIALLYEALKQNDKLQLKNCWGEILPIYNTILKEAISLGIFPNKPSTQMFNIFEVMDDEKSFIIATSFLEQILNGKYTNNDLLPSIAQAQSYYQVSEITVRRAYYILCEMGYTQTLNGIGTRVVSFFVPKSSYFLEQSAINRKEYYCEAVEFLEVTCADIVRAAKFLPFSKLRNDMDSPWNFKHRYSVAIIFYHLFKGANSDAVFSMYNVAGTYLYWTSYLKGIPATEELGEINHAECINAIDLLEHKSFDEATELLLKLLRTLYPIEKQL
ncbi:MAG: GntR family transcriptional regulator [Hydrogenoanaerobacterium sp.]